MSAPIRTRKFGGYRECREKNSGIARSIFSEVKSLLDVDSHDVRECKVKVSVVGHGLRPFGDYEPSDYIDLSITVGGKSFDGLGKYDVGEIALDLRSLAEKSGIEVEDTDLHYSCGNFTPDCVFPSVYRTYGEPCSEFRELKELAKRELGITLDSKTLYGVRLFGKRGRYGESGRRAYTAYDVMECRQLIAGIKSHEGEKVVGKVCKVDDIDTDYSRRYETECYGYRTVTIQVEPEEN